MVARNLFASAIVAMARSVFASPADPQVTTPARLEVRDTSTSPNFVGYATAFGTCKDLLFLELIITASTDQYQGLLSLVEQQHTGLQSATMEDVALLHTPIVILPRRV